MSDYSQNANKMMAALSNGQLANDAARVSAIDPMADLKENLVQFFKDRIKTISKTEALRALVYEKLTEKIEMNELSFDQIMQVMARVGNESNVASDSILAIFKPSPGAPSILANTVAEPVRADQGMEEVFGTYTPEQLQKIEKTFRAILAVSAQSS